MDPMATSLLTSLMLSGSGLVKGLGREEEACRWGQQVVSDLSMSVGLTNLRWSLQDCFAQGLLGSGQQIYHTSRAVIPAELCL